MKKILSFIIGVKMFLLSKHLLKSSYNVSLLNNIINNELNDFKNFEVL